jgi:hypothetical protein
MHNVIYAYGRMTELEHVLSRRGLARVEKIEFPSPHTHNYHPIFDDDERDLLAYWEWEQSPLKNSDS